MYSGEDSEWPLMYTFLLTSFFVFCLIDIILNLNPKFIQNRLRCKTVISKY